MKNTTSGRLLYYDAVRQDLGKASQLLEKALWRVGQLENASSWENKVDSYVITADERSDLNHAAQQIEKAIRALDYPVDGESKTSRDLAGILDEAEGLALVGIDPATGFTRRRR